MKRISKTVLYLFLMLLCCGTPVFSQVCRLTAAYEQNQVKASLFLEGFPSEKLFTVLENGIRSQIQFELRVYQEREGFLGLLGDKLVHELLVTQEAKWDVFNKLYILEMPGGSIHTFSSRESFLAGYLARSDIPLTLSLQQDRRYYLKGRIILETVKFLPPLNILSDIIPENMIKTDWASIYISYSGEGGT